MFQADYAIGGADGVLGRGFISALLSQSGYEVTFIDVAEPVINALQEQKRYPIRIVASDGYEDVWVEHVTAVNGNDLEQASDAIANCDIMATAAAEQVLNEVSHLAPESKLAKLILTMYQHILDGACSR